MVSTRIPKGRSLLTYVIGVISGLALSLFLTRPQEPRTFHMFLGHENLHSDNEKLPLGLRAGLKRMRIRSLARRSNFTRFNYSALNASNKLDVVPIENTKHTTFESHKSFQRSKDVSHPPNGATKRIFGDASAELDSAEHQNSQRKIDSQLLFLNKDVESLNNNRSSGSDINEQNNWCSHINHNDVQFMAPYFDFFNSSGILSDPKAWPKAKSLVLRGSDYHKAKCSRSTQRPTHVFGVGLSKTATSSLGLALGRLGYRNGDMWTKFWNVVDRTYYGSNILSSCNDAESDLNCENRYGGFWSLRPADIEAFASKIKQQLGRTRSTTDLPVAMFYDEIARAFPDAHFVLTTRSVEAWAKSAARQFQTATTNAAILRNRNLGFGVSPFHPHIYRKSCKNFLFLFS